jgi:phage/plasmid-associated DNA primase
MTYESLHTEHGLFQNLQLPQGIVTTEVKTRKVMVGGLPIPQHTEVQVINRRVAVEFMVSHLHPIAYHGEIYVYDASHHKYVIENKHIETFMTRVLNQLNLETANKQLLIEARAAALDTNTGDIFPFNPRTDAINCRNGVVLLSLDGATRVEHSHEYLFNYCIDTDYVETWNYNTAQLYTVLDQWGTRSFCIDSVAVGIAQSLLKDTFKTVFMAEGRRDAGKTTFLELVQVTLGDTNYSQECLMDITSNRFSLYGVEGKIVNVGDEAEKMDEVTTERLKRISGSVRQRLEKKGVQSRTGLVTASYIFACNDLPELDNITDLVFFGRWMIGEFKHKFPISATKKAEILSRPMREQFLVRVIERVQDILHNGFINPMSDIEVEEYWKGRTVGAMLWMSECLEPGDWRSDAISLIELHNQYCIWCPAQEQHFAPISDRALKQKLSKVYGSVNHSGAVVYRGVRFKIDTTPPKEKGDQSTMQEHLPKPQEGDQL